MVEVFHLPLFSLTYKLVVMYIRLCLVRSNDKEGLILQSHLSKWALLYRLPAKQLFQ